MNHCLNESIRTMTDRIVSVLDGNVSGVWLYGSVVLDDFQLGWSDIDFIALTKDEISETQARELLTLRQTMLEAEPDNRYYRSFEGVIINLAGYRSGNCQRLVYWGTSGQRITDSFRQDAFSAFELARYGRSVYGEGGRGVFAEPGREQLVQAVKAHYETIRTYARQTDRRLYSCGWLLDIARCIYTLRYHDVIAKTRAGIWALNEHLFPDESALRKTLEIRRDPLSYRDRDDVRDWLCQLGPVVQRYADVLEDELAVYR